MLSTYFQMVQQNENNDMINIIITKRHKANVAKC